MCQALIRVFFSVCKGFAPIPSTAILRCFRTQTTLVENGSVSFTTMIGLLPWTTRNAKEQSNLVEFL
jgi:hypothetical protein